MSGSPKSTIGQAIDQTLNALSTLDKREQQIVVSTICSLLEIAVSPKATAAPADGPAQSTMTTQQQPAAHPSTPERGNNAHHKQVSEAHAEHSLDIRSLKNLKQPASAIQMACVAAFYLQEHAPEEERTKEVSTGDLERLFKQAGFKLPSRMQQVLPDAKSAGYFESIDRGKYKLTRVGYNLVTHSLPKAAAA